MPLLPKKLSCISKKEFHLRLYDWLLYNPMLLIHLQVHYTTTHISTKLNAMKIKRVLYGIFILSLFLISGAAFSQGRQVTGTVTDSTGAPVANASVLVKNTRVGTQTASN